MNGAQLWNANTIGDWIQVDGHKHLPLERIPLEDAQAFSLPLELQANTVCRLDRVIPG